MIRLVKSCPLKYPNWFKINWKFLFEVKIHLFYLSADKNLDLFDDWLCLNRLVQTSQLDMKETLETISMNRINFTYSSSQYLYKLSRFILWFPKSLFYRTDQFQPVGSGTTSNQIGPNFFPRKMERWIFTSNKNFKFILNQLGYFKGQLFSGLIIK